MKQLVAVTSCRGVGGTFLDWSILYLAGLQQHYHAGQKQWVPIPEDPQASGNGVYNSHKHQKNHPSGLARTLEMLPKLRANVVDIQTVYPFPLYLDLCYDQLRLDISRLPTDEMNRTKAVDFWINDYKLLLDACLDQQLSLLYIDASTAPIGYHWHIRTLDRGLLADGKLNDADASRSEIDDFYFAESKQRWQELGLINVWDQRERMALNCRPFDRTWFPKIGMDRPYLHIDCRDLWNLAPQVLAQCFAYLGRSIHKTRWKSWLQVARAWQDKQHQLLCFFHSLDHIVDATLNGWYYPLPALELWQEAIIQHCLIYKHGCNLKTWQLYQFPDNTQKLNVLLEPNIHNVPRIY